MDLTWSPEEEAFRTEVRDWLAANLPKENKALGDDEFDDDPASFEFRRDWQRTLGEAGYLAMHWPKEYGGGGRTLVEQIIFNEEYAKANAPQPVNSLGLNLVGPTLMTHGTEEQRKRFLKNILTAEEIWCQGYSEPNAGSDLAGLQTKAEVVGDEFVINGQKIWTTLAPFGDWIFVLCRTDPDAPKHQGISYILCDMNQPGVEMRPIKQMTGTSGFGEVFFTDVRTPRDMLVGELNDGWRVAMTTLDVRARREHPRERGALPADDDAAASARRADAVQRRPRDRRSGRSGSGSRKLLVRGRAAAPQLRARDVADRCTARRRGRSRRWASCSGRSGTSGRRSSRWSILGKRRPRSRSSRNQWLMEYLAARASTIYTGTSEIQRNILAERVLGLPRGGRN